MGLTDPLARECIRLVAAHLERAWRDPHDRAAREGMMRAATLGGMAFANASVALVHGMSRPIGAIFHVPHGLSNAVLLPTVTRFSLPGAPARYATVARTMGLATAAHLKDLKRVPRLLIVYGLVAPLAHAIVTLWLCSHLGVSVGNAALLAVLAGSASYIAVPAVLKHAIPEAFPLFYLGLPLGLTFPFNILIGIPLYVNLAERWIRVVR